MAEAFPGGKLVFDAANRKAVKLMLKTWIKDAKYRGRRRVLRRLRRKARAFGVER